MAGTPRVDANSGPSGHSQSATLQDGVELDQALEAFGLREWGPVVLWIGGAANLDSAAQDAVEHMAALTASLVERLHGAVVDGATAVGVMRAMGSARLRAGHRFPLVGVAPEALIVTPGNEAKPDQAPLDPNHTHFILVPGHHWGDEVTLMSRAVEQIAGRFPTLTILFDGGEIARREVDQSLAVGRRVLVLAGTGRMADQLAEDPPADPLLRVIGIAEEDRLRDYIYATLKGEDS